MTVFERFNLVFESLKITQKVFADSLNISQRDVSIYCNGKAKQIKEDVIHNLNKTYKVNISWLLTGEGEMFESPTSNHILNQQEHIIKYYDVDATAGNVMVFDDSKATYKNVVIPGFDDCDFALNVLGDSMYPELKSGQIAILKEWKESYIEYGHTYLVVTKSGHRMLKRLRAAIKKDEVVCESANELFDPFELKKEDINSLYLVKGHVERSAI